jgi:subtilisin-like proprotein convertase family protein
MGLKFLDEGGSGSTSNAVRAVNYATLMRQTYGVNVRVTNNSWGGGGFSQALRDAINAGGNAGILFAAAAGNDADNNDVSPHYPSNYNVPAIISVAATDRTDSLARFSNYGAMSVDLAAPGVDILSTVPNNSYDELSGTSMATPHVSGVVALAWALSPASNLSQIRGAIMDGVDPLPALNGRMVTGGRLNARKTLERLGMNVTATTPAAGTAVPAPPTVFEVSFTHAFDPQTLGAADFRVNNIAATTVAVVDADTAAFTFAASPVTDEGPQTMQVPQGALTRQSDADPVREWESIFYFDALPTAVVSSEPAEGATLSARPSAIVLNFNEAIDQTSVGVDDLELDYGVVTSATALSATAVRYEVSGLVDDGNVTYALKSAAVSDNHGNPAGAHHGSFTIDDPLISHYQSADVPRPIGDLRTINSVINIATAVTIADLNVGLDITHTYDGDLDVTLVAPNGTRVELFSDVGGGGANFVGTVLDDEASSSIQTGAAPFTGRFRPEAPLSVLDGLDTVGNWTLEIRDDAGADIGTLNGWELVIAQAADIPPRIAAVEQLPIDQGRTWRQIDRLTVQFSEAMQPATINADHWELREAGADEAFDTPDDVLLALVVSPLYTGGLSVELPIAGGPLPHGEYRFTAPSALLDLTGNALDGNGDRTGGDPYVRHFDVVVVQTDRFEPNDGFAQATDLGELGSRTETSLTVHSANNDDYYRFTAAITGAISADVLFNHEEGDLEAALYDSSQVLLTSSATTGNDERMIWGVTAGQAYYLRVSGSGGVLNPNYILELEVSETPAGDRFEPNDSFAQAHNFMGINGRTEPDLSIHFPRNDDYYRFIPTITGTFAADVLFSHATGDLDVALFDANQTRLTYSDSRNNDERIVWNVTGGQTYYLQVYGYNGAMNPRYTLQLAVSLSPVADRFEPNNSFTTASNLGSVEDRTEASLSIHEAENDDYYRFTASTTGLLTAEVQFSNAAGDIDMTLYDADQIHLRSSTSTSDIEQITWSVSAGETYYLQVYGYDGAINRNYTMQLSVGQPPQGDRFEPNDTFAQATNLGELGSRLESDLSIHFSENDDYYRFTAGVTGTLSTAVLFRHADGDIDIALYDANEEFLDSSESVEDSERISIDVVAGRTYYLHVYGYGGDTNPDYTLTAGFGIQGTPSSDVYYLKSASDGETLDVYDHYPLTAGSFPFLFWPMDADLPLSISTHGGDDTVLIELPQGAPGPVAGLQLDAGAGSNNQLVLRGGRVHIDSTATAGTLNTTLQNGAQLTTSRLNQNRVTATGSSRVNVLPGGPTSALTVLDVGSAGTLDLADNDLVIQSTAGAKPALLGAVYGRLAAGYSGGLWNGAGIVSANAAVNQNSDTGLALVDNALLGLTEFGGMPVDENALLLKYTYYGDIDLNGQVDADDLTVFANNFGRPTGAVQIDGDIDFDGDVDADDLTVFANNFGKGVGAPLAAGSVRGGGVSGEWSGATAGLSSSAAAPNGVRSTQYQRAPTSDRDGAPLDVLLSTIAASAIENFDHPAAVASSRLPHGRQSAAADSFWADYMRKGQ